jgi:valyl-tRNA synthetase
VASILHGGMVTITQEVSSPKYGWQKMEKSHTSKSLGNVIDPVARVQRYGMTKLDLS